MPVAISVFFPCYNDRKTIGTLIRNSQKVLEGITSDFEIIVVDDGSEDESRKVLKLLKGKFSRLRLVFHKRNKGYGGALKSGFKAARKEFVFYMAGDGQYDVRELTKLVAKMNKNIDVVSGFKIKRRDPWYRLIIGKLYYYFVKFAFNLRVCDINSDFRLIRKTALDSISLETTSGAISVELVRKLQHSGYKFVEVGIHHYPRLYGRSQFFNIRRVSKTLFDLIKLWWKLIVIRQYA